jgi:hypothetical protein
MVFIKEEMLDMLFLVVEPWLLISILGAFL